MQYRTTEDIAVDASDDSLQVEQRGTIMTIHMPRPISALTRWRDHHPRHVKSDWDAHLHPHHQAFIENAAMARMMDHL